MIFQTLIIIATCLCENFSVLDEDNGQGQSTVFVKQGVEADGCDATFNNPCPTITLAMQQWDTNQKTCSIKILNGSKPFEMKRLDTTTSGKIYYVQGALNEVKDEIATVAFPTDVSIYALRYQSDTRLKNLKFLCPAEFDMQSITLIASSSGGAVSISLNTITFERQTSSTVMNANSPSYTLMYLEGQITIYDVVITSSVPWALRQALYINTKAYCTVYGLSVTNVTSIFEEKRAAIEILSSNSFVIENSSFTNCRSEKGQYAGAVFIHSNDSTNSAITFKTTIFTGCTAPLGLAGALYVKLNRTEEKVILTGDEALAFTGCSIGTGDKEIATAAHFLFDNTATDLENLAKKIKDSFGKNYDNKNHKNLIIGQVGEEGEEVDLAQFWPDPKDDPSKDAAFGWKINFVLFFVALLTELAALL